MFTAEEEAALRGDVRLRGEGYRLRDARYHPDFIREGSPAGAQPLVANGIEAADILRRFEWGVRRSGEIRLQTHSHRFESNRGSASISPTDAKPCLSPTCTSFRSPFPPPRPSVDVIARNPFIAASRFDFEIKNVDREDIISDEVAALDYSFDNDGDNNDHDDDDGEIEAGTEAGARRASSLMREWKLWSQGWREELAVRMGFQWKVSFEEGADDRDGEGEE